MTAIKNIATRIKAGASAKEAVHYVQMISTDSFQHYDYGKDDNMKKYG